MNRYRLIFIASCVFLAEGLAQAKPAHKPPNFLIILADDMGFSDAGCYGGEIETPNLDRLAAGGLRFTQFYNTARCWPTRSCILTGYYAQQIRMDPPRGRLPAWTRVLPEYLKPLGYRCYHTGKWHLLGAPKPVADGGFDRSYWFQDWDRYFSPARHFEADHLLPPVQPESGYYATTAFADHAIRCLREHAEKFPDKPFFQYLAFIAPHFPLHALPEDIAKYRDRYLEGWDVVRQRRWTRLKEMEIVDCNLAPLDEQLAPRYFKADLLEKVGPGEIKHAVPWTRLSEEQRRFQATKMAIHAAMVDRMDREIGRVLDQLRAMGTLENTVIFFLSDNGADATLMVRGEGHDRSAPPGSARSFLCLGPGWASASNAPFRRHKIWVSEGGISTPLIVHWPKGITARGELRHDVGHVIDLVPTLLDLAGAEANVPAGAPPLPGKSLVPAFAPDGVLSRDFLFFAHEGNRALRMGDWKLVSAREDGDVWELFDLGRDRCESRNLAEVEAERVRAMTEKWIALNDTFQRQAGPPVARVSQVGPAKTNLTDRVSQHGITWQFAEPAPFGQFVNGDYYVVGPVTVVAMSPRPEGGRNGSVLNLPPVNARSGFDSRVAGGRYAPDLVVKLPLKMKPGDAMVSSISVEKMRELPAPLRPADRSHSPARSVAVLTCLKELVPADAFRPSYCDRQQKIYLARNLRRELLPRLPPIEGPVAEAGWVTKADPQEWADRFQRPWIDTCAFNFDVPAQYMPHYGREVGRAVGITSLVLMCDFPPEQKERLLVNFVQYGIDLLGIVRAGHPGWPAHGGHGSGRKWPILFAGIMLGDREIQEFQAKYPPARFGEDMQTMYGKGWNGAKALYAGHMGAEGSETEKGWGAYEHLLPSEWQSMIGEDYRRCCTSNAWVGQALAAHILHAEKVWNHDAFFDYVDRWMGEDDTEAIKNIKQSTGKDYSASWLRQGQAWDPFVEAMWKKYRHNLPPLVAESRLEKE